MAITPIVLDILNLFCGRKNVRLGVNENPSGRRWSEAFDGRSMRGKCLTERDSVWCSNGIVQRWQSAIRHPLYVIPAALSANALISWAQLSLQLATISLFLWVMHACTFWTHYSALLSFLEPFSEDVLNCHPFWTLCFKSRIVGR